MATRKKAPDIQTLAQVIQNFIDKRAKNVVFHVAGQVKNLVSGKSYDYFDLNDNQAAIRCYVSKEARDNVAIPLQEGAEVVVSGTLGVYIKKSLVQLEATEIQPPGATQSPQVYTPGTFNPRLKDLVERAAQDADLYVSGTIFKHKKLKSHEYFDLGDDSHYIRCIVFNGIRQQVAQCVENNAQVEVVGRLQVYARKAMLQLVIGNIQAVENVRRLRYEQNIKLLEKRGLWPKRPPHELPKNVERIGLITSSRSKALTDFCKTFEEEGGTGSIIHAEAWVAGKSAAEQIATHINQFSQLRQVDVVVITRGGGSEQDLAEVFDDVELASAICQSAIPVATAIGHSNDDTFADRIADLSFDTPTRAAIDLARRRKRGLFRR